MTGLSCPQDLATDGSALYWISGSTIEKYDLGTSTKSALYSAAVGSPSRLVAAGAWVYWVNWGDGSVMRTSSTPGGQAVTITSGAGNVSGPTGLAAISITVVWSDENLGVRKAPQNQSNGGSTSISTEASIGVASFSPNIFFETLDPLFGAAIKKYDFSAQPTLVANLAHSGYFVVDASGVYVGESEGAASAVKHVPLAGGTQTTLATATFTVADIDVDSAYVYWIDTGGTAGIYRVAK